MQFDLSGYSLEEQLPDIPDPVEKSGGMKSRVQLIMDMARSEKLSMLELGRRIPGAPQELRGLDAARASGT
ncbi:hypothetical protein ACX1C1_11435 [Paenibacillus sp. strain BS8-2]